MATEGRSTCPISIALEAVGDRWTLLLIRDLAFRARRRFKEFHQAGEGIASNILSDRLRRCRELGIVTSRPDPEDGRSSCYYLTDAGLDLLPVLVELARWGLRHDPDAALPPALRRRFGKNAERSLAEIRAEHRREREAHTQA